MDSLSFLSQLRNGIPFDPIPNAHSRSPEVPHAPSRNVPLSPKEKEIALQNALRYFPPKFHAVLKPEFSQELEGFGHIYMYRFTPRFPLKAYPIDAFPAATVEGRAVMLMICNNLDPAVAQFPQELVTYGGNGQVFSNWAQV
jgi:urocanate hydratase